MLSCFIPAEISRRIWASKQSAAPISRNAAAEVTSFMKIGPYSLLCRQARARQMAQRRPVTSVGRFAPRQSNTCSDPNIPSAPIRHGVRPNISLDVRYIVTYSSRTLAGRQHAWRVVSPSRHAHGLATGLGPELNERKRCRHHGAWRALRGPRGDRGIGPIGARSLPKRDALPSAPPWPSSSPTSRSTIPNSGRWFERRSGAIGCEPRSYHARCSHICAEVARPTCVILPFVAVRPRSQYAPNISAFRLWTSRQRSLSFGTNQVCCWGNCWGSRWGER